MCAISVESPTFPSCPARIRTRRRCAGKSPSSAWRKSSTRSIRSATSWRATGSASPPGGRSGLRRAGAGGARQCRPLSGTRVSIALYDPMLETYWTLRQALAWATRRDANDVRECTVVSGDIGRWPRKIGVNYGKQALNQAFTALRQAIESGALVVNGIVTAESRRRDIASRERELEGG